MKSTYLVLIACFLVLSLSQCAKPQAIKIGGSPIGHVLPGYVAPIPLIIIAGESNAGGLAVNADLTAYELAPRTSVKILNNTNLTFESLDIGTNNLILHQDIPDNATHGMENGLANCADSALLGTTPIYILKAGTGSSTINWWNDSTFLHGGVNAWQQCKTRVDTAIKLLTTLNSGVRPPIYLFWSQGVNNATSNVTVAGAWRDSTKSFFTKFRLRYGATVPIIMTHFNVGDGGVMNAKMDELVGDVANFYTIATPSPFAIGGVHWDSGQFKIIASTLIRTLRLHYTYR